MSALWRLHIGSVATLAMLVILTHGTGSPAAHAQEPTVAAAPAAAASDAVPEPRPRGSERRAGEGLEQIIVSARKREEALKDAPLSVSAFSATALRNGEILRADELTRFTPNLKYEQTPGLQNAAAVSIRGVGNTDVIATRDNGVGIYVDGVYLARASGQLFGLADVQRVEVLRGPQGTLFGRNTIGGAINVITQKPTDEFTTDVSVRAGNLNLFQSRASVNVPIVPGRAAALFSFQSVSRDGYTDNQLIGQETDDRRTLGLRAALRLNPTEQLELLLTGEQTRSHQAGRGGECRYNPAALAGAPAVQVQQLSGFGFVQQCLANQADDEFTYNSPLRSKDNLDTYGITSQITYELADLTTFKSLSSWQRQETEGVIDLTYANVSAPCASAGNATPYVYLDIGKEESDQVSQ